MRTYPDEHVVDEVSGVSELAPKRGELEERVRDIKTLDGRLSMLEGLADPHHWVTARRPS
jgi:hypothetical protein